MTLVEIAERLRHEKDDLRLQLAAALKERDAYEVIADQSQATLAAADKAIHFLEDKLATALKERDEAQAVLKATRGVLELATVANHRLRAALEPSDDNVDRYAAVICDAPTLEGDGLIDAAAAALAVLAAIRARAGLEQLDHVPGHREQGDQQAGGEHQPAELLGLAVGRQDVDHHADEGHQERDDERDGHLPSVGPDRGGGKEG